MKLAFSASLMHSLFISFICLFLQPYIGIIQGEAVTYTTIDIECVKFTYEGL